MTRQTEALLQQHQITRELHVRLDRSIMTDVMSHLVHQPPNAPANSAQRAQRAQSAQPIRRASIASTNLFLVGNEMRETGFDYFERIPRSNIVNLGTSTGSMIAAATVGTDVVEKNTSSNNNNNETAAPVNANEIEADDDFDNVEYLNLNDLVIESVETVETAETINTNEIEASAHDDSDEVDYLILNDFMLEYIQSVVIGPFPLFCASFGPHHRRR